MKLPAFYVLDAISKNVFDPYARAFTPIVIQLFLESYEQVDQNTRSKMDEMLLTWRTGAPNGKELFGVGPQVAIERGIWGGNSSGTPGVSRVAVLASGLDTYIHIRQAPAAFSPGPDPISKPQVLSELEFTLGQKQRALQLNPYDSASQNQVNALRQVCNSGLSTVSLPLTFLLQLRSLVDAGVSQDELRQILGQLRAMVRDSAPPPPSAGSCRSGYCYSNDILSVIYSAAVGCVWLVSRSVCGIVQFRVVSGRVWRSPAHCRWLVGTFSRACARSAYKSQ